MGITISADDIRTKISDAELEGAAGGTATTPWTPIVVVTVSVVACAEMKTMASSLDSSSHSSCQCK